VKHLWIVLILLGQLFLLSYRLADQCMWTDEMYTARIVRMPTLQDAVAQIRLTESRPPLHYLALWGWARVVGYSEWGMRFLAIAGTLLATALAYRLAGCLISWSGATWAALLSACAPTLLWHGRIIRGYAVAVPLVLLSTLVLWKATRSPQYRYKVLYVLCCFALLFTDYLTLPIVVAHVLYVAGRRWLRRRGRATRRPLSSSTPVRERLGWLIVGFGLLAALAGLLLTLTWQCGGNDPGRGVSSLIPSGLSLKDLASRAPVMLAAAAFVFYSFSVGEAIFPWSAVAIPGVLAALLFTWVGLRHMWRERRLAALFAILLIATTLGFISVVGFGALLGLSMLVIAAARVLYLGPLLAIPMGAGLEVFRPRRVAWLLLAVLVSARSVSLLNQTAGRHFLNPVHEVPVRELAVQVSRSIQPGDLVIFEEPLPFDAYFRELDADTPLFTPASHHIGHTMASDVQTGSPAFLGQGEPFVSAIGVERLVDYLKDSLPSRLWLVVFHHEGHERTVETEIGQPLAQLGLYRLVCRVGYAPQDRVYAQLRSWLRQRPAIEYKAEILLYARPDSSAGCAELSLVPAP
jgi:hypothetical protein